MEVSIAVMHGLGSEGSLGHVSLQDIAPIQYRGLCLGGRVQRGPEAPFVQRDLHKGLELMPLHPALEGPEPCLRPRPLRGLHKRIARADQALELSPLRSAE